MAAGVNVKIREETTASSAFCILLVAPSPPPYGGMALQARQLEKRLTEDGNSVIFFPSNFDLPGLLRPMGKVFGLRTVLRGITIWMLLWREAKRVEVVHVMAASWLYFFAVVFPAVVVGRLRGKRVVLNYRGGGAAGFFRWFGWAVKPVLRRAHVITVPSEFLAKTIRESFNIPVSIVSNILDTSVFRYRERASIAPRMLVTRHLEEIYDVESALRAFRQVHERHPEATLWIAGKGSQEEHLRGLAAEWKIETRVRFLGHVPHQKLPEIYDQCDILLNASRVDNFPGALIEASAAGVVVVSTGSGGIPYVFENGVNALLVESGDWQALAAAVEQVLTNPALAHSLRQNAAAIARRCDWRQVREALYGAYSREREWKCVVG